MAKLQIALDFIDLNQALEMAGKVAPYCDILEAGTPLVKSVGMECVRQLKKSFPLKLIFADLKTMDAGEIEVNLAASAGANYVSVMAAASVKTVTSAINTGKAHNVEVVFDLMGTIDKLKRAQELQELGVQYLHIHTGLDEQTEGQDPLETLTVIAQNTSIQLTVAGGINSNNLIKVLTVPKVDIVMIGSAITSAGNPAESAKIFYRRLKTIKLDKLWNTKEFSKKYRKY